ncbi:hemin-degrading factor [Alcaligenes sp. WGS1538]|uniref:hemin-degrading factor n=1 Tax=Alcaligenes sp. WGS1538 TaxID=3366811 RepID=UPI00372D5A73
MQTMNGDHYAQELLQRFESARQANPQARMRNVAQQLGVSEYELLRLQPAGVQCMSLQGSLQDLLRDLEGLGRVMALSRNESAVHERHGRYEKVRAGQSMGIVLGPDIDLRLFMEHWGPACWVSEKGRESLQFFDVAGQAVHKVYRTGHTDALAWDAYLQRYRCDAQPVFIAQDIPGKHYASTEAPATMRQEWLAMKDTHELHGILERAQVSRLVALRDVGGDLAQAVPLDTAERMLQHVAAQQIPIMCFVGNRGIVQIHSGPVQRLLRTGSWFNVLDPNFNLHLNTDDIVATWVVTRPSADGWITSLECFDAQGALIVQFFGERKPGAPELAAWRALLQSYCPDALAA